MAKRHAEIAGAGFAGLTAAAALCQRGWSVRVHEIGRELRAYGAGIFLWENGLHVLNAIGAFDETIVNTHQAKLFEDRDHENRLIGARPFPMPGGGRMVTMTRQHLYAPMLNAAIKAGAEIHTNSEVVGADPKGVLRLADGSRLESDLLIAADGVRSKVRDSLDLLDEHTKFPFGIFRLLVPRTRQEAESEYWSNYINFWRIGETLRRILYVPCNARDLYLLLGADIDDAEALAYPIETNVWTATFPFLDTVLARIGDEVRYDQYELLKLKNWSSGRVAIIGDAAHAMPPTIGQGAGSAMMSALSLAVAVDESDDIESALRAWEARERPITENTQEVSRSRALDLAPTEPGDSDKWPAGSLQTAHHVPTGAKA